MEHRSVQKYGVLLVGSGAIARQHLDALAALDGGELVGVVDIDSNRAAATARASGGVAWTTDLTEALRWRGVDACIVCTPNNTHAAIATEIARAGKHLLVEKPLTTSVSDAFRLVREFAAVGRVLMAAHTHRHYDYARSIRQVIADGSIGTPSLVRLSLLGGWIWPDWRSWVIDAERTGGHSLHNGVHVLDLARWWMGDAPESIRARGQRQTAAALEISDYLEIIVRFRGGGIAVCEMSRAHRPASIGHRDISVIGTEGRLSLDWDGEGSLVIDERGMTTFPASATDGFARQLETFLQAIRGECPAMSAADGALAVAMGVAAEQSISSGTTVLLADVLKDVT